MTNYNRQEVLIFAGSVSALLVLRFAFSFFPESRVWGFNQAAFVPFLVWIYPALILVIVGIFVFRRPLFAEDTPCDDAESPFRISPYLVILISILAGVWFYILRVQAHFLGDGYLIIDNPDLPIKTLEYGEAVFHRWLIDISNSTDGAGARTVYQVVASVSGAAFVAVWLICGVRLFRSRFGFVSFVVLGLTLPGTLLFYGYVEHYSIAAAILTAAILCGTAALYRGTRSIFPLVFFALAVVLHSASLVYAPAFAVYICTLLWPRTREILAAHAGKSLVVLALLILIGTATIREVGSLFWRLAFLPVAPGEFTSDGYFLLSASHIVDYLNILFLLMPVSAVMLGYRVLVRRRWIFSQRSPTAAFFILMSAVSGMAAAFCIEPKLGMARDWDLLSIMLIGAAIGGVVFLVKEFADTDRRGKVIVLAVVAQLAVFVPWLSMHLSHDVSKEYALAVMKLDPRHSRTGFHIIGAMASARGDVDEARRVVSYLQRFCPEEELEVQGSARYRRRQYGSAADYFERAIREDPKWYVPYQELGMCRLAMRQYHAALASLRIADALNPYNAHTYLFLGNALYETGDTNSALDYWHKSMKNNPSLSEPKIAVARHLILHDRPDSAIHYLRGEAGKVTHPEADYWHGVACWMIGDVECARERLAMYLKRGHDDSLLQRAGEILRDLEESGEN